MSESRPQEEDTPKESIIGDLEEEDKTKIDPQLLKESSPCFQSVSSHSSILFVKSEVILFLVFFNWFILSYSLFLLILSSLHLKKTRFCLLQLCPPHVVQSAARLKILIVQSRKWSVPVRYLFLSRYLQMAMSVLQSLYINQVSLWIKKREPHLMISVSMCYLFFRTVIELFVTFS